MATPNISKTTMRCLRATTSAWQRTAVQTVSRRSFHTPPPLYLDFLAPSWPAQSLASQSQRRTQLKGPSRTLSRRQLSSTPHLNAVAIRNPRKDDSGNDRTITIAPRAAHRLQTIAAKDCNPDTALRVTVESGGCHGFQYLMSLTDLKEVDPEEDTIFENEDVVNSKGDAEGAYKAKVVMDEASLELLGGSTVDYTMELIGSQFKVTGIPGATSSCGCGSSFDVAA